MSLSWRQRLAPPVAAALVWLGVWTLVARAEHNDILLVEPLRVAARLLELLPQGSFWQTVAYSLVRIAVGFGLALLAGTVLAHLAALGKWFKALIGLPMSVIRAVPVVSFIILVLIWAGSSALTVAVSAIMVLPLVYANVEQGLASRNHHLVEFAKVFGLSRSRRWAAITVPGLLSYLVAACRAGVGQAWKAGVSAEVIGLPTGSIGERLYQAKLYLSSADLLAWTLTIVLLSFAFEKAVLALLRGSNHTLARRYGR